MRKPMIQALVLVMAGAACGSAAPEDTGTGAPGVPPGGTGAAGSGVAPSTSTVTTPGASTGVVPGSTAATGLPGAGTSTGTAVTPSTGVGVAAPGAAAGGAPTAGTTTPDPTATAGGAPASNLPAATGGPISEACRGLDFTNMVYSPGGDVLPNKCEAFHATLNNPYAVRCTDAWPWYKTVYPGDAFCLLPPDPSKGMQIGVHPQGEGDAWIQAMMKQDMSGYTTDPGPGWTLPSGGEEERNIMIKHTNMAGNYYRIYNRMRGGSHHMIVSSVESSGQTFVWGPGGADGLFNGKTIPGAERPDDNTPQAVTIPEEDLGLYRVMPANVIVQYNMHHFNSTDKTILKEAWQNIWWTDNAKTPVDFIQGLAVLQAVGTFANPGETVDMHYQTTPSGPIRILGLFGHRHAWTTNFTAWIESAGKDPQVIYQSFDWFDEPTYNYNSQVKNPLVKSAARTDGAATGIVNMAAGDTLHFNCHIEYTDARAMEVNSPVTPEANGPLRFANEAFNAEMCILFGASVGDNGQPEQLGPPPAFASQR